MEKYQTCKHAESIGQIAVYVTPGCKRASMVRGNLVSSKKRCMECKYYEEREEKRDKDKGPEEIQHQQEPVPGSVLSLSPVQRVEGGAGGKDGHGKGKNDNRDAEGSSHRKRNRGSGNAKRRTPKEDGGH